MAFEIVEGRFPVQISKCDAIFTMNTAKTRNVGQCPTWWPPCRI